MGAAWALGESKVKRATTSTGAEATVQPLAATDFIEPRMDANGRE